MPRPTRTTTFAALVALLTLAGLDQTLLSTALPLISAEMHGQALASWVFSAYLIASTLVIPLYGKLADRRGPRPLLVTAGALFVAGSAGCAASPGIEALIAARALQGLGGGGLMTLTLLSVAALFEPEERGPRQAVLGAAYGMATMVGPLVGGLLVQHLSWRWALLLNAPAALAALAVLLRARFGAPAARRHRLDLPGAALLAVALVALLLSTRAGVAGTAEGGLLMAAAAALLAAFVAVERRAADPLLPLALFGNRGFGAAAGLSAASGVTLFAAVVFFPMYLQTGLRLKPTASALTLLPLMLGLTVASNRCGRALRRERSPRMLGTAGALSIAVGFGLAAAALAAAPGRAWPLSLAALPIGMGLGALFPVLTVVSQRSAGPRHIGIATATPMMLRALGGALGTSALGALLGHHLAAAVRDGLAAGPALSGGVAMICAVALGLALLAALVARRLPQALPPLARAAVAAPAREGAAVA